MIHYYNIKHTQQLTLFWCCTKPSPVCSFRAAAMTLRTVLLSLQALLAAAEPDDPQDAVVANQVGVHLCLTNSLRICFSIFFKQSNICVYYCIHCHLMLNVLEWCYCSIVRQLRCFLLVKASITITPTVEPAKVFQLVEEACRAANVWSIY